MQSQRLRGMGRFLATVLVSTLLGQTALAGGPAGTTITYQGLLTDGGIKPDGPVDFDFRLFDDEVAGTQVGTTDTQIGLIVTKGLFTAELDFGVDPYVSAQPLWLEVTVDGIPLSRQKVTSAPFSLGTRGLNVDADGNVGIGTTTPAAALDLGALYLDSNGTQRGIYASSAGNYLEFTSNNDTEISAVDFLRFQVGPAERALMTRTEFEVNVDMFVDGNVGIGTTTPGEALEVVGKIKASNPGSSPDGSSIELSNPANNPGIIINRGDGAGNVLHRWDILIDGNDTLQIRNDNPVTSRVVIDDQGQMGLGTTTPTVMLDVDGDIHASGTITSGSSITIDGSAGTENITSSDSLDVNVVDGRALRLETNATSPNVIGGAGGNSVTSGAFGAAIGGGGTASFLNLVTDDYGAIGGGANNLAGDDAGTTSDRQYATVGGGDGNKAQGNRSTVGGGGGNTASGFTSTIGGGEINISSGLGSMVPGGRSNTASGSYSLAAGRSATASHDGSFVWSDDTAAGVASSANNEFTVLASGGARFFSNSAMTAGVSLAAGGGSWSTISDRNTKENFKPVDGREALERVAAMPIQTWNYKAQDDSIRHIGPMAQDLFAAFGVGELATRIATIDADGVALAAIQGLNEIVSERDCAIAELEAENAHIKARLARIEALIAGMNEETLRNAN